MWPWESLLLVRVFLQRHGIIRRLAIDAAGVCFGDRRYEIAPLGSQQALFGVEEPLYLRFAVAQIRACLGFGPGVWRDIRQIEK